MNKLATIIPIHKLDSKTSNLFKRTLESIKNQKDIISKPNINIVTTKDVKEEILKITEEFKNDLNIIFLINDGNSNFQSQINFGVNNINEEYFNIVEFDDELNSSYYKNALTHINELKDVDIFLSMILQTNEQDEPIDFSNQHVWSKQFVGENGTMGYLNPDLLNNYTDFKICGSIINRNKFLKNGGLKTNIELTFQYEFLLRMMNNNSSIYIIPKLGYKHVVLREGSLFDYYLKNTNLKERKFWFETAQKEHHFNNQREIRLDKKE